MVFAIQCLGFVAQDSRFRIPVSNSGFDIRIQNSRFRIPDRFRIWFPTPDLRIRGSGFRVPDSSLVDSGFWIPVSNSGLDFCIRNSGFLDSGFWIPDLWIPDSGIPEFQIQGSVFSFRVLKGLGLG